MRCGANFCRSSLPKRMPRNDRHREIAIQTRLTITRIGQVMGKKSFGKADNRHFVPVGLSRQPDFGVADGLDSIAGLGSQP